MGFGIYRCGVGIAGLGKGLFVENWGLNVVESAGRCGLLHVYLDHWWRGIRDK